ncbi:MAG TPA: RNA-binding protein, partial [Steroidobacter sp.]
GVLETTGASGVLQLLSGLKSDPSMTTIYVGNLPFSATEADVRGLFEKHGTVQSVKLINDRETGRPRGFGFVEMPPADAQTAIQHMNGFQMGGRPLRVNEAREREQRPPRQNGRW